MKKSLSIVLAGGEGARLLVLTHRRAKPVVLFGGQYRVIDFVISNIVNSGLRDIGIVMQHEPDSLLKHIGFAWNVDRSYASIDLLFPHKASERYLSPADAVYKRMDYILDKNPVHVVIVPGDYVSLIDYRRLFAFHESNRADLTIAGINVPSSIANRFGMMSVNSRNELTHYVEKPSGPVDTTIASMGIYIFNLDVLIRRLVEEAQSSETMSFTYGLIPNMVGRDRVFVYPFDGYWRDIGTIDAYFEANLELIKIMPELNLYDIKNPIRSRIRFEPPAKICEYGYVKNAVITQGCLIDGHVERSVIFPHVRIDKGAEIYDSLIMPNNHIGEGTVIRRTIIDTSSRARHVEAQPNVGAGCVIGGFGDAPPNREHPGQLNTSITLVGMESEIPDNTTIGRNCIIYPDTRTEDYGDRRTIPDGESIHPRPPRM